VDFTVWDTGIGIAAEDLPRLFQDFVQLDARLARQYEGAGLGLALVRRLVELHGGHVKAESDGPGQGSRFTVSLPWPDEKPLAPSAENNLEETRAARAIDSGANPATAALILVADDNPAFLEVLQATLAARGYPVALARDGEAALALAQQLRPAVVVMDVQMPKLDGLEAIRQMRADSALAATPILALTALAMPGDRERCLAAGANAYLTKPVNLVKLAQTIDTLCPPAVRGPQSAATPVRPPGESGDGG
jgi:CheY-like chemotaxis protein